MHSNDQHFLIIGAIEYADPSTFRKPARGAPQKIMFQFLCARLFEAENLAAFRVYSGHYVPDGAILAGSIHPLKDQQKRIAAGCVVKPLQRAQLLNVFFQEFLILLLRLAKGIHNRRPLCELDLFPMSALGNPSNRFSSFSIRHVSRVVRAVHLLVPSFRISRSAFSNFSTARTSSRPSSS